jgi:hypothetical protein
MRPITQEEVDQSLRDKPIGKAPVPDGFTLDFFHHCWSIIREDIWEIIKDSIKSGQVLQALNTSFLTLIPKENHTTSPAHFRTNFPLQCHLQALNKDYCHPPQAHPTLYHRIIIE